MRLAAIILAVILVSPGVLWGQVVGRGSRAMSSPRQTDKSYSLDRQKRRARVRNPKKQTRSNRMKRVRSSRKKQVRSSTKKQSRPTKKTTKSYRRGR